MGLRVKFLLFISLFAFSCQQFTLSEADQHILEQANRNLESIREDNEQRMTSILYAMQKTVRNSGNRPADINNLAQALSVFKDYKNIIVQIDSLGGNYPIDSALFLDLSKLRLEDEIQFSSDRILPFNPEHLKVFESHYTLLAIEELSKRHGVCCGFDQPELSVIEGSDSIEVLLTFDSYSGHLINKITLSSELPDTLDYSETEPWVTLEYTDIASPIATVSYYDRSGLLQEITFHELKDVKLIR